MVVEEGVEEFEEVGFDCGEGFVPEFDFGLGVVFFDELFLLRDERGEDLCLDDVEVLARDEVHSGEALGPGGGDGGKDTGGVVEVAFGGHDGVDAGFGEAAGNVLLPEDIAVGEEDGVWWEVVAEVADVGPVCEASVVTLLVAGAAVDGEDGGPGGENHFGVFEGALFGFENADFGGDWDREVEMKVVDHLVDEVPFFLEVGTVVAFASDALRAAEVEVDSVAVGSYMFRSVEEIIGIVGTKLDKEWSVVFGMSDGKVLVWWGREGVSSVGGDLCKDSGMVHWGICEYGGGSGELWSHLSSK